MIGRYPVAFLFLGVSAGQVDVNVPPTKAEVRSHDKDRIYQFIQQIDLSISYPERRRDDGNC